MVEKKATEHEKDVAEKKTTKHESKIPKDIKCKVQDCGNGCGGAFYFLGFIGALVYYLSTAPTFWDGFLGFFKAIFWPAFLVHGLLIFLGA